MLIGSAIGSTMESATESARSEVIAQGAVEGDSSLEGFLSDEVRVFMWSEINRVARGCALPLVMGLAVGCHHQAANPTTLAPELGGVADEQHESPLLSRGDKVLVVIDGEKKGTGTFNGERVVLDPPLDTLAPSRIDSARVRVGPGAREMYGLSYRMVGVLLVWLHPISD
jgi:hypothetical protein